MIRWLVTFASRVTLGDAHRLVSDRPHAAVCTERCRRERCGCTWHQHHGERHGHGRRCIAHQKETETV